MMSMSEKLRCFFVRSARDVAAQALPNWAQISVSLAENFYEVFVACPDEEQRALLEGARVVSVSEWASIRGQVASELGERYAEALDQAKAAMNQVGADSRVSQRGAALRSGLERSMQLQGLRVERRRLGRGVARSLISSPNTSTPPPRSSWPAVPGFELTGWLGEGAQAKVFVAKREGTGD